jgi:hypothetical protein
VGASLLVALFGGLGHLTDANVSLLLCYLVPVAIATWYARKVARMGGDEFAVSRANVFMSHDLCGNHPDHPFMPPQRHALSDIKVPPATANLP